MNVCLCTNDGNCCGSRGSNEKSTEFLRQLNVAELVVRQVRESRKDSRTGKVIFVTLTRVSATNVVVKEQ